LSAAARLADVLVSSGARRIAFLGLAKNVGKTTALLSVHAEMRRRGTPAGITSAGRDGEAVDAITGEPKPRVRVERGDLIASASVLFEAAGLPSDLLEVLPSTTRFGAIEIRRASGSGELELMGPSTASQVAEACVALERAGARIVLLDGALGRRAFASARVARGIVLSVGMAAAGSLPAVCEAARLAVELIRLPKPAPGREVREFSGALTDEALRADFPRAGEVLVAEDFASIFLSPEMRRRLRENGITLAVRGPARLLAVTANPTAPARPPVEAAKFFTKLREAILEVPVFDLVAGIVPSATIPS
jgi:hypothetical protein